MAKITSETTFPRTLSITDTDGKEVFGWIMQPYMTGMYVAYKSGEQGSIAHSGIPAYLKKIQKAAEKEGHTIEVITNTYGQWVDAEEFQKYYN